MNILMNKRVICSVLASLLLSGCDTIQAPPTFTAAQLKNDKPKFLQAASATSAYRLTYGSDPALASAFNQYIKTGKAPNINSDGFVKIAYNAGQQPIINTTPFQITVVSLEAGEKFTNITTGDPSRWTYSAAISGAGANVQQNVLIKPSPADESSLNMATNMVITTDKRLYNIRLVCAPNAKNTRQVSFWYPEEMVDAVNKAAINKAEDSVVSASSINLNNVNFNYKISSGGLFTPNPSWMPLRVFDDGKHTYIQFPESMTNRDMPALFIVNGSNKELVNYRSKAPYFVVDKLFKQATLVLGIGSSQQQVTLTNNA